MTSRPIARLVSIVIPAYNAAGTLRATVESALTQSYRPIEIVVVDDGSRDSTAAVVESFGEPVRLVRQANGGAAAARNRGIEEARGEFIAFLDSDDLWVPDKLARQIAYFDVHPEVGAQQCGARFVDDAMRTLEVRSYNDDGDSLWDALHFRNMPAILSALIVRRSCLDCIGGFDTSLEILEEWDMAIKTARHCALAGIPDPLVLYRVHRGNRSRNVDIHVVPGKRVLDRLFEDPELPQRIARNRRRIYGTLYRMLAGGYFRARQPLSLARWAIRAVATDPAQIAYMLAMPLRKIERWRATHDTARRQRKA